MHGFGDQVFAKHRGETGATVSAATVGSLTGAFELDVEAFAGRCQVFAEEDGATVAEGCEVSKLVAGVGLGDRFGAFGQPVAG